MLCDWHGVIRDEKKCFVAAKVMVFLALYGIAEVEALAAREGLVSALDMGFMKVEMESDSKSVVDSCLHSDQSLTSLGLIVEDIMALSSRFDMLKIMYYYREANMAAHNMTRISRISIIGDVACSYLEGHCSNSYLTKVVFGV